VFGRVDLVDVEGCPVLGRVDLGGIEAQRSALGRKNRHPLR
jgi:hypothetical protein